MQRPKRFQISQPVFHDMILGTLLYAVILGFFNDYTDIVHIDSFSFVFMTALVLQLLTMVTFAFKRVVVGRLRARYQPAKATVVGVIWVIMFGSKFVFLAAIEILLGHAVSVSGAFGLMAIVLIMATTKYMIDRLYVAVKP